MSSILKALEKVETDLVHQNQHQGGTEPFRRINAASSHGVTKASTLWKRLGLVFCVVLLTAAGWFFAVNRPTGVQIPSFLANLLGTEKMVSSGPTGSGGEESDPGKSTGSNPSATVTAAGKKTETAALPPSTRPKTTGASRLPRGSSSGQNKQLQPEKPVQKDRPNRSSTVPRNKASAAGQQGLPARDESLPIGDTRPKGHATSSAPAKGPGPAENKSVSSAIPVMRAPDLKLHAIAWSPYPAQRMAVVNNSITREGETVDGFSVVRIAQDEIIIRKGQEQWRLMLR